MGVAPATSANSSTRTSFILDRQLPIRPELYLHGVIMQMSSTCFRRCICKADAVMFFNERSLVSDTLGMLQCIHGSLRSMQRWSLALQVRDDHVPPSSCSKFTTHNTAHGTSEPMDNPSDLRAQPSLPGVLAGFEAKLTSFT